VTPEGKKPWKVAEDFVVNSASGRLPTVPEGVRPPRLDTAFPLPTGIEAETLSKEDALGILWHERLHAELAGIPFQAWICHREGDPEDRWVVDTMSDGHFVRLP